MSNEKLKVYQNAVLAEAERLAPLPSPELFAALRSAGVTLGAFARFFAETDKELSRQFTEVAMLAYFSSDTDEPESTESTPSS